MVEHRSQVHTMGNILINTNHYKINAKLFNLETLGAYSSLGMSLTGAVIECLNKFGSLDRIGRNLNVLPD